MTTPATDLALLLAGKNISQRELARRADIQPSMVSRLLDGKDFTIETALKIFIGFQSSLHTHERLLLMQSLGLEHYLKQIDWSVIRSDIVERSDGWHLYHVANQMYLQAKRIAQDSWQAAIPAFESVEILMGAVSNLSVMAACDIVSMHLNLGASQAALTKIELIQQQYSSIFDPYTEARFLSLKGWVEWANDRVVAAENSFLAGISVGQRVGRMDLSKTSIHMLGRLYVEETLYPDRKKQIESALQYHRKAEEISIQQGDTGKDTFPLFRYTQALQSGGYFTEAKTLRKRSADAFGKTVGRQHINVEMAKLLLQDADDSEKAQRLLLNSLEVRAELGYKGGLIKGLRLLGLAHTLDNSLVFAFEAITAAFVMCYQEQTKFARLCKLQLEELLPVLDYQFSSNFAYNSFLATSEERAKQRFGYYGYLDAINNPNQVVLNERIETLFSQYQR